MKLTSIFALLLSLALIVGCGGPSAPSSPENTESYGSTHEGAAAEGRNPVED